MYLCKECKTRFESPIHYKERHSFNYGLFEEHSVCPNCGRNNYERED